MQTQSKALELLQKNVKAFIELKNWPWRRLYTNMGPIIEMLRQEKAAKEQEELARQQKEVEAELKRLDMERRAAIADDLEAMYGRLEKERNELCDEILALNERLTISQRLVQNLTKQRTEYEAKIEDLQDSVVTERSRFDDADFRGKELEVEVSYLNDVIDDLQPR